MATREKEPPTYNSASSAVQQPLSMVNPNYPLPTSIPLSTTTQQSLPAEINSNGMTRTSSRRRKTSGRSYGQTENRAQPIGPEATKALPVTYDYSYPHESPISPTTNNLATFAARARAAPNDLIPGNLPESSPNTSTQTSRAVRRGSINRPPGAVYLEIRGTERKSLPSPRLDSNPPRFSSNNTAPKLDRGIESGFPRRASSVSTPSKAPEDTAYAQSRSASRRLSSGTGSRAEWASDRSPLQKLEVKLNDISKEEKRARVEEAEQLLRQSKAAGQSRDLRRQVDSSSRRRQPEYVPSDKKITSRNEPMNSATNSPRQALAPDDQDSLNRTRRKSDQGDSRSATLSGNQRSSSRAVSSPQPDLPRRTGHSTKLSTYTPIPPSRGIPITDPQPPHQSSRGTSSQTSKSPAVLAQKVNEPVGGFEELGGRAQRRSSVDIPEVGRSNQAVRALRQNATQDAQMTTATKRNRATQPQIDKMINSRVMHSTAGPVPNQSVASHDRNEFTQPGSPRRANDNTRNATGASIEPRHLVTDPLFSQPVSNSINTPNLEVHSGVLHEWRQGRTARLPLPDLEMKNDATSNQSAWWEKGNNNTGEISDGRSDTARRELRFSDGDNNKTFGKHPSLQLHRDNSFSFGSAHSNPKPEQYQVRGYLENDKHPAKASNHRFGLRTHTPILSTEDPLDPLLDAYSYSCPQLSEHNIFHPNHICQPYVSKELIRSMRSIRLRVAPSPESFNPPLYLKCGPLLRYTGLKRDRLQSDRSDKISYREIWRGSVMIVTTDRGSSYASPPVLQLSHEPMDLVPPPPHRMDRESEQSLPSEYIDPIAGLPKLSRTGKTIYVKPVEDLEQEADLSRIEDDGGLFEETRTAVVSSSYGQPSNQARHKFPSSLDSRSDPVEEKVRVRHPQVQGVRLCAERGVTFWRFNIEVELGDKQARIAYRINNSASVAFWVPACGQSMNIMFHTCNGFSISVNPAQFSGPDPLWRDVLNHHQTRPFHVMIGGGDQIYNDAAMTQTTLFRDWLKIKNPHHKHEAPFSSQMHEELETFYLERYCMWFSQGLFGMANSQIPMINMWDDHDIIDGYGSYPDHFMRTPVFRGVGAVAHKYYMLFQHQSVTEEVTADEPSWLLGATPGPYIHELGRSVFMFLGKHIAFLGLDCRTERKRDQILSDSSYDLVFDRCRREIVEGETKHLIVLLGVPIAYPRLVWLENILTSRAMDPIKALGRAGLLGGFLNKFDGSVEVLDDLDDHWTSKSHKHERNWFLQELQEVAAEKSVRVTILGGDVHLAAIGQFYSNPKLKIPKDQDHRYMANVISSAIVNTPPPEMMGDILNKRNKIHHLDDETDESMIPIFTHDVDGKARNNKRLLPRRNWCALTEYYPGSTPPPTPPLSLSQTPSEVSLKPPSRLQRTLSLAKNDVKPKNLLRRLSQRGSVSTRDSPLSNERHSSSPAVRSSSPGSPRISNYFTERHNQTIPTSAGNNQDYGPLRHSSAPLPRPGNFHRRPTNISEKAARKGDEGHEQGHINLEYGLDVVIKCEINQKDPAGMTRPYRLLVPALWYQGEGDLNAAEHRKIGWIKRLGSVAKRQRRTSELAKEKGQGSLEAYSDDSQSLSASEFENDADAGIGRYGSLPPRRQPGTGAVPTTSGQEPLQHPRRPSGNAALYGDRRSSKVDDMLGMAGPAENGNGNAGKASGNHARWSFGSADGRLQPTRGGNHIGNSNHDGSGSWSGTGTGSGDLGGLHQIEKGKGKGKAIFGRSGSTTAKKGYDGIEAYRPSGSSGGGGGVGSLWRRFF